MDLGSGITFEILPMFYTGRCFKSLLIYIYKKKEIQCDDLEDGYNVARPARQNTWKQQLK